MNDHCLSVLERIGEQLTGNYQERERKYRALSQVERDLHDINMFHGEVIRGGLGTFFSNSSGRHWRETLEALQRAGAPAAYQVVSRACTLLPGGAPSADPDAFDDQVNDEPFREAVGALDTDMGEVWLAMEAYCAKHFPVPPDWKAPPKRSREERLLDTVRKRVVDLTATLRSGQYAPAGFYEFLTGKGVDWSRAVMLTSHVDGGCCFMASLIDDKRRLIELELQICGTSGELTSVDKWTEQVLSPEWWKEDHPDRTEPRASDPITVGLAYLAQA